MKKEFDMNQMEKAYEDLNIDEEAFAQMTKAYTERFMVAGEPITDLRGIVSRAPESLLDNILETWEKETETSVSRAAKEKEVCQTIMESFNREFVYLEKADIEILLRTMNGHPLNTAHLLALEGNYCPKGWAFMFCDADGVSFHVPDEIQEILRKNLEDDRIKTLMGLITGMRLTMLACINLYGAVEKEKVLQIAIDEMFEYPTLTKEEKEELEWLPQKAGEALEILLRRQEGPFWEDGAWLLSEDFENRRQYKQFLRTVEGRDYYIPNRKELYLYAEHTVDIQNPYYKKVSTDLTRLVKDKVRADNLLFEMEYLVAQEDLSAMEIMDMLRERDIEFSKKSQEEQFAERLSEWIWTVRRWSNRGFTDQELGKRKSTVPMSAVLERPKKCEPVKTVTKKIGRNDPCPCGSGKKYKKCCGK